jgi:[ribosomal protein S5]-alanine N-acetyltransferase
MTEAETKPFPEHLRMPATPVLETPRLILRPLRAGDIPAIQRRFPKWEIVQHLHDEVPWPYPENGAAENMARVLGRMDRREQCFWALTLRGGDDELIGRIDLWADDGQRKDQRGFWLDTPFWGRGMMTEAADRVTDFALVELGWPHLWLSNAEANLASHRVKEKQGAIIVERTQRGYVYGPGVKVTWLLTREAWLARRGRTAP